MIGGLGAMLCVAALAGLDTRETALDLAFVGDMVVGHWAPRGYRALVEPGDAPFADVAPALATDLVVGNLETPVVEQLPPRSPLFRGLRFGAEPHHVAMLASAGFGALNLANNHIVDLGADGLEASDPILRRFGIAPIGSPQARAEPPRVETRLVRGWRVALIGAATWLNARPPTGSARPPVARVRALPAALRPAIASARRDHDVVVVVVHWGREYATAPGSFQRQTGHALIDDGADLVIGHHPHVLQGIEQYGAGLIAYSLGNFLFVRLPEPDTRDTGVLRVRFRGRRCLAAATFHAVELSNASKPRPTLASVTGRARIHQRMRRSSRRLGTTWTADEHGALQLATAPCPADPSNGVSSGPRRDP